MKAHELYTAVDPAFVTQILDWFRANDKNVYRSAVATLATNRKLRPVFIEKKSMAEQYAWIHKTLKLKPCDTIGEHLLQAYLMAGQQSLLAMFCDGMGIPHDGKGSVVGDLPKKLDPERLNSTIDRLVDIFEPACSPFTCTASTCRPRRLARTQRKARVRRAPQTRVRNIRRSEDSLLARFPIALLREVWGGISVIFHTDRSNYRKAREMFTRER